MFFICKLKNSTVIIFSLQIENIKIEELRLDEKNNANEVVILRSARLIDEILFLFSK